ncbi:hypothetical protein D0859_12553 [Hortaea werneckii]|uniref:WD repeat-containing protein JIP5 n=1 Tax=Hortaea werneckii TaxID=91943 RepID=A0A3M7ID75_HORWE|nr:hypothetical protein D0859_12553 [Hortaea werneckii]
MFDTICTLPLSSDLFTQAVHPTEPLVAIGLSSGHVSSLKLPPVGEEDENARRSKGDGILKQRRGSNGDGVVDTAWRTRRHKGSCRCLSYSIDGRQLYSAGTDGIVKAADSETGKVTRKLAIPGGSADTANANKIEGPTVIHALSPQTLLLGTDAGALHLYDLRDPAPTLPVSEAKQAFINPRPASFSKQWLTTGGTTLALTDLRRGVLVKSEDQEELLLSSLYVSGLPTKKSSGSTGEKALVGGGDGVITLWEKGQWDDQDERIHVSREKETIDALAEVPRGVGGFGKNVAVGLGDGKVRFIRLGQNKIVGEVQHDEMEGVVELGFDVGNRMISGGGQILKVWQEHIEADEEAWEDEDEEDEAAAAAGGKRAAMGSDEDSDQDDEDSSDEEEKSKSRRKKRKRGKGPAAPSQFNFSGLD